MVPSAAANFDCRSKEVGAIQLWGFDFFHAHLLSDEISRL